KATRQQGRSNRDWTHAAQEPVQDAPRRCPFQRRVRSEVNTEHSTTRYPSQLSRGSRRRSISRPFWTRSNSQRISRRTPIPSSGAFPTRNLTCHRRLKRQRYLTAHRAEHSADIL